MLKDDLQTAAKDARSNFRDFDDCPDSVQRAILDMQFNMGLSKFNRDKWTKFFDAVENKHWQDAARESHRKDVKGERNKNAYQWFMESR